MKRNFLDALQTCADGFRQAEALRACVGKYGSGGIDWTKYAQAAHQRGVCSLEWLRRRGFPQATAKDVQAALEDEAIPDKELALHVAVEQRLERERAF